jgi:MtN3 and saliva related transmembrane protein
MLWELIGITASICTTGGFVPQIVKAYRSKKLDDLSLPYIVILSFGVFMWLLYGLHLQDIIIITANSITFTFGLTLISLKLRYSGNR